MGAARRRRPVGEMTRSAAAAPTLNPTGATAIPWPVSFVLLAAIWGCSFWWIKLGLRSFSPVDVAFGRLAVGALALLFISGLTRTSLPRQQSTWRQLFVLAVLLNSLPFTLISYGETHISAVLAGIINALTPVAALLMVLTVFREELAEPSAYRWARPGLHRRPGRCRRVERARLG